MFKFLSDAAPKVIALSDRFPWAMPLFGFGSGLASFLLVDRNQELARVIAVMVLASWCWFLAEKLVQKLTRKWFGFQMPHALVTYAAQLVHQESLFFVIPFLFITTAWNTGQSVYTAILLVAALISLIDPIYFRWLEPRRSLYFAFQGLTLFAVLQTLLPIIFQLPTAQSYFWSLGIAIGIIAAGVGSERRWRWWQRALAIISLITLLIPIGLYAKRWIPPAVVWLTDVAITSSIDSAERAPQDNLKSLTDSELRNGLYAYTAISAPRGLNERIYHEWRLNGQLIDRVPLDIRGGRKEGYRAWTHKMNFPPNAVGRWQIRVVTEADQQIGVLRFRVVEDEQTPEN